MTPPSPVYWLRKAGALAGTAALAAALLFLLNSLVQAGARAAPQAPAPQAPGSVGVPLMVSFQGRVQVQGASYTGVGYFKFAVVDAAGSTSYWSNDATSSAGGAPTAMVPLAVNGGLFTVLLGDTAQGGMSAPLDAAAFAGADRRLRVWFSPTGLTGSFELLSPDQAIASAPFALNAQALGGVDAGTYVQAGQGLSRLANDSGFISQTLADARYSRPGHDHSALDIVSGTLADGRLSPNVVLNGQNVTRLANNAGYISQTLADGSTSSWRTPTAPWK